MKKLELNHWYINESQLEILLRGSLVNIKPLFTNERLNYKLTVIDFLGKEISFVFETLEEATTFTEEYISNSVNMQEIAQGYVEFTDRIELRLKNN